MTIVLMLPAPQIRPGHEILALVAEAEVAGHIAAEALAEAMVDLLFRLDAIDHSQGQAVQVNLGVNLKNRTHQKRRITFVQ